VTYATNAPEVVGQLLALDKSTMSLGRRGDQDIVIPEATVSGTHAVLRWQQGTWLLEDLGSTNGSYADHNYERKSQIALIHGGEVQVGECRMKLVRLDPDSLQHKRARQYLAKRDGLTGLLVRDHLLKAIDEDGLFGEWAEAPMQVARFELRGPNRQVSERPTILEMLALRRAAQRVVELTEMLLLSLTPVVAGRTGPLKFVVSIVGPTIDEARHVVEQVVSQVQGLLPDTLELAATLVKGEPARPARTLVD
jgi:eukaryotic-like serine/threonine-protein kinase